MLEGNKYRKPKTYIALLMIRKFSFIMGIMFLQSFSVFLVIGLMIVFQIGYFMFLVMVKPYDETKINIIETLNELFNIVFLCGITYFNSESRWTDFTEDGFVYFTMANCYLVVLIIIGKNGV